MTAVVKGRMAALIILLAQGLPGPAQEHYSSPKKPNKTRPRWLTRLDGKKSLAELSIPGTHDSCALYGGGLAECQRWGLADQLEAGIRFIDVRCRHIDDAFQIHHGIVYQRVDFATVRDQCEAFLRANPGECIVMSVKSEYDPARNKKTFSEVFKGYLVGHERHWYTGTGIPKLADVRGKIVLVARERGIGGVAWNTLKIQDDYQVPSVFAIAKKWDKVKTHLQAAGKGAAATWYVDFCSGTGLLAWPTVVADSVNRSLFDHLPEHRGRTGTLIMDFPGEALIERIIAKNAREKPAGK